MIHISRPVPPSAEVVGALTKRFPRDGLTELERARDYYAQVPTPTRAYEFKCYKAREVCVVLDDVFHEKCAYCESSYRAVDARNVEHFRPKGAVTEAPMHPGYWWLAAMWTNLLPSCPPCNQLRRQVAFSSGMTLEEFDRARLAAPMDRSGKANSFPVVAANWVLHEAADYNVEDPLLINPCERRPEQHLEWVFDWDRQRYVWEAEGVIAFVRPCQNGGSDDLYGKASIAVYGLNRAGLVRERMARVKEIQLATQPVVDTVVDLTRSWTVELEARLRRYKDNLESFTKPDRPYAGMARAFMALFDAELARFAAAG